MGTWHVEAEFRGQLTEQQIEQLGEAVQSITYMETGEIELRWRAEAANATAATNSVIALLAGDPTLFYLIGDGIITGPHRVTVMDDVASAARSSVVGVAEGATLLKIGTERFRVLRKTDPHFPPPIPGLGSVDIWEKADLIEYAKRPRKPGRPRKDAST